jgi:hypothetical protein
LLVDIHGDQLFPSVRVKSKRSIRMLHESRSSRS